MAALALAVGGCDQGTKKIEPSRGPALHVVATYPADGEGADCDPATTPACGVQRNAPIELRVDRFLYPSSAIRQAIKVYSGSSDDTAFFEPTYDVVERVVSYRLAGGDLLVPGVLYTVEILIPDDDFGLRAFDRAPLVKDGSAPLTFSFRTAMAAPPAAPPRAAPDCWAVVGAGDTCHPAGMFELACATGDCHGSPLPGPMGLDLKSGALLRQDAIGQVAHQTDIGPTAGTPLQDPARFGVAMPIIDPGPPAGRGRPENSYLLYKVLTNPENWAPPAARAASDAGSDAATPVPTECDAGSADGGVEGGDAGAAEAGTAQDAGTDEGTACRSRYRVPLSADAPIGACAPFPEAESARLREWLLHGEPMPPPSRFRDKKPPLNRLDLRTLQDWIGGGAKLDGCE